MFRFVRPQHRLIPAFGLALITSFAACDEQPAAAPGVQQDTASAPDLSGADSTADSAAPEDGTTPPRDTAVAPDTAPADTTEPPDAADTTEAPDSAAPPDSAPADGTAADGEPADTAQPGDTIVLPAERPPIVTTASTFAGDWEMEFGKETTKCVVKRLDNTETLWVSQIRTVLNKGSHHLIVYKSSETEERATPFNCDPFVETLKGETFPLMITQIREETLTFPNGVAFKFEPHQMVRLEAHYLNYFPDTTITAHADVYFDGIAAEDVVAEANMLFYGNPDLDIPEGEYSTPWRYLSVLPDTKVFALTGHTHAYGTNVEIAMSSGVDDPGMSIYPGDGEFVWDEPPVTTFDPALAFGPDQGFRYRCTWDNTSGERLGFGESARQEMCFLWAYYYPSQGYRLCVSPGSIGGGVAGDEVCCPGHWVCDYIRQFL